MFIKFCKYVVCVKNLEVHKILKDCSISRQNEILHELLDWNIAKKGLKKWKYMEKREYRVYIHT